MYPNGFPLIIYRRYYDLRRACVGQNFCTACVKPLKTSYKINYIWWLVQFLKYIVCCCKKNVPSIVNIYLSALNMISGNNFSWFLTEDIVPKSSGWRDTWWRENSWKDNKYWICLKHQHYSTRKIWFGYTVLSTFNNILLLYCLLMTEKFWSHL